jgi:polyisoprenoid-binding protein YceI
MTNKKHGILAVGVLALVLFGGTAAWSASYSIDASHSEVQFKVRHLGISNVTGSFPVFEGQFTFVEGQLEDSAVRVTIDASSINTGTDARDEHLRSPDFFDVAEFPELRFESTSIESTGESLKLHGNLTIRGVTLPVVLDTEYLGAAVDPWGKSRVGFAATTKINRKDYGLTWNKALEAGGLLVGEEVEIMLAIQGIEQKAEAEVSP